MSHVEQFDHRLFGVSRAEANAMDPQQRLLLEHEYSALRAAGLERESLEASLTGVFLGISTSDFTRVLAQLPGGAGVYAATGTSQSIASGRLSFVLGLQGPCASYDTACSAALVAQHGASRSLQLDECVNGVVSGVNIMLTPDIGTNFAIAGMTSVRGQSRPFDMRADGYARAEACFCVSLGGLLASSKACVLAGSAVRQDGRSASLTAPSGHAQQKLLRTAHADACIQPDDISSSEAHGTGTCLLYTSPSPRDS